MNRQQTDKMKDNFIRTLMSFGGVSEKFARAAWLNQQDYISEGYNGSLAAIEYVKRFGLEEQPQEFKILVNTKGLDNAAAVVLRLNITQSEADSTCQVMERFAVSNYYFTNCESSPEKCTKKLKCAGCV